MTRFAALEGAGEQAALGEEAEVKVISMTSTKIVIEKLQASSLTAVRAMSESLF